MLPELPPYISVVFALTSLLTLGFLLVAVRQSPYRSTAIPILVGLVVWLGLQTVLGINEFYLQNLDAIPPRFLLTIGPPLLLLIWLFASSRGRNFVDSLPLLPLTYLHVVRIPVELVLYWLFLHQAVPELMTFAGRNFDILAGITAPLIAYFGLQKGNLSQRGILIWNYICLGLVLFIVGNAILSAPLPFQQFAFDQPNVGVFYFPFIWLPSFVVPSVFLGHLISIRRLSRRAIGTAVPV